MTAQATARRIRRGGAAVLGTVLPAVMLAATLMGSPASAAPYPGDPAPVLDAAEDGADYLVSQLADGNHLITSYTYEGVEYSYADQGLTADAVVALLAQGDHPAQVTAMTTWLATQVNAYADPNPTIPAGGNPAYFGPYSGALAKLALVASSTGGNPHSFGGFDLLGIITSRVCTGPDAAGTCTAAGDFYQAFSSISQSLGILALQASPVASDHLTVDSAPVVRLRQLQCDDGGFTSALIAEGEACVSSPDATGFAIQALAAVPGTDLWLGEAQTYLAGAASDSGVFAANPDSTAQAAIALQTLSESLDAPTAPSIHTPMPAPTDTWAAAIAGLLGYELSGVFGLPDATVSNRVRSTAQAVLAASFGTLVGLAGAPLQSAPRTPAVIQPTTEPPATEPATTSPTTALPAPTTTPALAATGADRATSLSIWGAALVLAGALALAVGRPTAQPRRRH